MTIIHQVACTLFNISPLEYRRTDLCTNYAIKLYRSPRSSEYFTPAKKVVNTRSELQLLVQEKVSNTKRCHNAPHNYLARLVNANKDKIEKMCQPDQSTIMIFNLQNVTCGLQGYSPVLCFVPKHSLVHRIIVFCSSPLVFINKHLYTNQVKAD